MTQTLQETDTTRVHEILNALEVFINKRPGLDWRDYGNERSAYQSEVRSIGRDRKRALVALKAARQSTNHDLALLLDSFRAFSGRLTWEPAHTKTHHNSETGDTRQVAYQGSLSYCTGQYFPTEYRKAAAAVLETYKAALAQKWARENPQVFPKFRSIAEVKAANQAIGNHWFERSNMRFFNTRIVSKLISRGASGRQFFITSERMDDQHPLRYSVREALPNGEIDTLGEFHSYLTIEDARMAITMVS